MVLRDAHTLHSPVEGASCSHRCFTSQSSSIIPHRQRRRRCKRHSTVPSAQYDPRTDRGRGPATGYADDRQQYRGQYDYPPSPASDPRHRQQEAYRPPDTAGKNGGGGPGEGGGGNGGPGGGDFSKALLAGAFVLGIGKLWYSTCCSAVLAITPAATLQLHRRGSLVQLRSQLCALQCRIHRAHRPQDAQYRSLHGQRLQLHGLRPADFRVLQPVRPPTPASASCAALITCPAPGHVALCLT